MATSYRTRPGGIAVSALGACIAALVLSLASRAPAEDASDVDTVLQKIDSALFFSDAQEKLKGYTVDLKLWSGGTVGGKGSAPTDKDLKPAGTLVFDAAKGEKRQEGADQAQVAPGTFTPGCGPWTLTALVGFEVDLFATPFGKRFTAEAWDREVSKVEGGYRLVLTPKEPIGEAFMLKPALTGIEIDVSEDGVPTVATLHLDQKMMHDDGTAKFVFVDEGGKKRIERIENDLLSANLHIQPVLAFKFAKVSSWLLPDSVEFRVPGANLSGTMAGMEMITTLFYRNYAMTK